MDTLIDGNETSKEEKEKTTFESTIIDLLFVPAMMASDVPPKPLEAKSKPAIGRIGETRLRGK